MHFVMRQMHAMRPLRPLRPLRPQRVVLPEFSADEPMYRAFDGKKPRFIENVFDALKTKACMATLRSLTVESIVDLMKVPRDETGEVDHWECMLQSIAEHLPDLQHLCIEFRLCPDYVRYDPFEDEWAALLPRRLTTLHLPETTLDNGTLNTLIADVPTLRELRALELCVYIGSDKADTHPIKSALCRWERLELSMMPSYRVIEAFTDWPDGLELSWAPGALERNSWAWLHTEEPDGERYHWEWNRHDDGAELGLTHAAAARAAEKVRRSYDGPGGIVLWTTDDDEGAIAPLAPLAGIVREVRAVWARAVVATSTEHGFVRTDAPLLPCTCGQT